MNPPAFKGESDPIETESWVLDLEKYFEVLNCSETQKFVFATFMLSGKEKHWWRMEKRLLESQEPLEWEKFKDAVFKKYFPRSVHRQKESKFIQLRHGNMIVAEYETKFTQLSIINI